MATGLAAIDIALFEALNGLIGRSWAFDTLVALSLDNVFVKAGPIGAAFFYAWYRRGGPEAMRGRSVLLATLAALFLIAPITKAMSDASIYPRPFLLAESTWLLEDGALRPAPAVQFREPQTGDVLRRVGELHEGMVERNDHGSFPSDHAAFFTALALGIFLACRAAGAVALAWTVLVVLAGRVAMGMHWPLDVIAGAAIGAGMLAAVQIASRRTERRLAGAAAAWMDRHPGWAGAVLFLFLLEAANTMQTLKRVLELVAAVAGRLT